MMKNKRGSQFDAYDESLIFDNLLRLEIFYKEFNYEEIQETPAYPVHSDCLIFVIFLTPAVGHKKGATSIFTITRAKCEPISIIHLLLDS